jgi:hypothetical protein
MEKLKELGLFLGDFVESPRSNSTGVSPPGQNPGAIAPVSIWDLPAARAILDSRFPDMLDQVFTNNRTALNDKDSAELKKILERAPAIEPTSAPADTGDNHK